VTAFSEPAKNVANYMVEGKKKEKGFSYLPGKKTQEEKMDLFVGSNQRGGNGTGHRPLARREPGVGEKTENFIFYRTHMKNMKNDLDSRLRSKGEKKERGASVTSPSRREGRGSSLLIG